MTSHHHWRHRRLFLVVLLTTCIILCLSPVLTRAFEEENTEKKDDPSPGPAHSSHRLPEADSVEGAGPPPVLSTSAPPVAGGHDDDDDDYDYADYDSDTLTADRSASGGDADGASPKTTQSQTINAWAGRKQQIKKRHERRRRWETEKIRKETDETIATAAQLMQQTDKRTEEKQAAAKQQRKKNHERRKMKKRHERRRRVETEKIRKKTDETVAQLTQQIDKRTTEKQAAAAAEKRSNENPTSTKDSNQPSSQPSVATGSGDDVRERRHAAAYAALFQPAVEEYDLLKFDPYSLSGAPLGGWGRATRSRLARLPLRLVSDFGGGVDLWYGSDEEGGEDVQGGGDDSGEDSGEGREEEQDEDAKPTSQPSPPPTEAAEEALEAASTCPPSANCSTGPHFSIHDATGQRYVCRFYAEDELVVASRLDSVFRPAVTVWDVAAKGGTEPGEGDVEFVNSSEEDLLTEEKEENGSADTKNVFMFVDENGDKIGSLPKGVRDSVAQTLRNMGMVDAAEGLERQVIQPGNNNNMFGADGEVEVDIEVLDTTATDMEGNVNDHDELNAMMEEGPGAVADELLDVGDGAAGARAGGGDMTEIIKAGLLGARRLKEGADDGAGDRDQPSRMPPQLTLDEIYAVLSQLAGLCSQIHLGWWSYEWCHLEGIRQFHVAAVPEKDGKTAALAIQDIVSLGRQLNREAQIIYPKGDYGGVKKTGRTSTIMYDAQSGTFTAQQETIHTSEQDEEFALPLQAPSTLSKEKKKKIEQMKKELTLGHGGPIVRQTFVSGDYCEKVNKRRSAAVELRCCTERDLSDWRTDKKKGGGLTFARDSGKNADPLAVLVGIDEDSTCSYRARVCTPLLCPKPVEARTPNDLSSSDGDVKSTTTKTSTPATDPDHNKASKKDPIAALLDALVGEDFEGNNGPVNILLLDEIGDIQKLTELVQNGGDFANHPLFQQLKMALKKSRMDGRYDSTKSNVIEIKDGMSLRELLANTLGKRSCLLKQAGWWTYEFCYAKHIRQYHVANPVNGIKKQQIESEHRLGTFNVEHYPPEDEHLHVINATSGLSNAADKDIGDRNGSSRANSRGSGVMPKNTKQPGGNGAVYVQEYSNGDVCDDEDVATSVIKGGNVVHGPVERSSTVRFSCGKHPELVDIKEDSTCKYILDVTLPELCQHALFKAPVTKTQVVKCLPV